MKALILRSDADAAVSTARVLIEKGFQILCVESHKVAYALVRLDTIDLLVMDERINGQLTHSLMLSAERRNPYISGILFTDRIGKETDDLYELFPCLYALVGRKMDSKLLGKLAVAAVSNKEAIAARVAANAMMDAAEEEDIDFTWDGADMTETFVAADPVDQQIADVPAYADVAQDMPQLADHGVAFDDHDDDLDDYFDELDDDAVEAPPAAVAFRSFERFDRRPSNHIAQVSIIGEGRPVAAKMQ